MKDKNFWIQVIVQTVAPLLLGGSVLAILTQFKEDLPEWSYDLIISAVYFVFAVVLLALVVALVKLLFGDWFTRLQRARSSKKRRREDIKIAEDWQGRWNDLRGILMYANNHDWNVNKKQKESYANLRLWFNKNRSKFLEIWHYFMHNRRSGAHESLGSSASLAYRVYHDNHDDPFSYFYKPPAIDNFYEILRYSTRDVPAVLTRLSEDLGECIEWLRVH